MIFIDTLSLTSCLRTRRLLRKEKCREQVRLVQVLDPIPNNLKVGLLIKGMQLWGISVREANFFAGRLLTSGGENVWNVAQAALEKITFAAADNCLAQSKVLEGLNREWGRNTILLYLAKHLSGVAGYGGQHTVLKVLIAKNLSRHCEGLNHHLVLGMPTGFTPDLFDDVRGSIALHTYALRNSSLKNTRLAGLFFLIVSFFRLKSILKRVTGSFQTRPEFGEVSTPALLLLQEDDLSMDRSYRGQPHWLFKDDPPPSFRTLVLENNNKLYETRDHQNLRKYKIYTVPKGIAYSVTKRHVVQEKIKKNPAATIL